MQKMKISAISLAIPVMIAVAVAFAYAQLSESALEVKHTQNKNGEIKTIYKAPKQITILI